MSVNKCKLSSYRNRYELKKAVATIIFKINNYFILKGWGDDEDLLPLYSLSLTTQKVFDENIYMKTLKEKAEQDVQIMTASSTKSFIMSDKQLSKDKQLMDLLKKP